MLVLLPVGFATLQPSPPVFGEDRGWEPVNDPGVGLSLSPDSFTRPLLRTQVAVSNNTEKTLHGALRLVIEHSLHTVLGADGLTPAAEPYFLLLGEGERLEPGEFTIREISVFRGPLVSQAELSPRFRLEHGSPEVNSPPHANAGPDQNVALGDRITLDGSGSTDLEGERLTYSWRLSAVPQGSLAQLSETDVPRPSFTVDLPGQYSAELVVSDGLTESEPDTVVVSTGNTRPTADAGTNRLVAPGGWVGLNGSASSDPDADKLKFRWTLSAAPANSRSHIVPPTSDEPRLFVDEPGDYVASLVVSDSSPFSRGASKERASVVISTDGLRPAADAGPDVYTLTGEWVFLDGSVSFDPDGDPIDYRWALLHAPPGSAAELDDTQALSPALLPDLPGDYVAQLIVSDRERDSAPDTVLVVAEPAPENRAPIVLSIPPEDTVADIEYRYPFRARDPDPGDDLEYELASGPWGMVIDSDTGLIRWTPSLSDIGEHFVHVRVADPEGLDAEQQYQLQVIAPPNRPPAIHAYPPPSAHLGEKYRYRAEAKDPDGDSLTYSLYQAPVGMEIRPDSGEVHWAPETPGTYRVSIRVEDPDGASGAQTFDLRVIDAALPPPAVRNRNANSASGSSRLSRQGELPARRRTSDTDRPGARDPSAPQGSRRAGACPGH